MYAEEQNCCILRRLQWSHSEQILVNLFNFFNNCLEIWRPIELMINKIHGLLPSGGLVSPSGGFASLLFDQVGHFASIKLCLALSHQGAKIKIPVVRCPCLWCLGAQFKFAVDWRFFYKVWITLNWGPKHNKQWHLTTGILISAPWRLSARHSFIDAKCPTWSNKSDENPPEGDTKPPGGDNPWVLFIISSINYNVSFMKTMSHIEEKLSDTISWKKDPIFAPDQDLTLS